MHYAFEDRDNLYLVIDLMSGGDLRYHIGKKRKFTEEQTSKCDNRILFQSAPLETLDPLASHFFTSRFDFCELLL